MVDIDGGEVAVQRAGALLMVGLSTAAVADFPELLARFRADGPVSKHLEAMLFCAYIATLSTAIDIESGQSARSSQKRLVEYIDEQAQSLIMSMLFASDTPDARSTVSDSYAELRAHFGIAARQTRAPLDLLCQEFANAVSELVRGREDAQSVAAHARMSARDTVRRLQIGTALTSLREG